VLTPTVLAELLAWLVEMYQS